ncbi:hypothetical protein Tco_0686117 [Tanacetum coccineum]
MKLTRVCFADDLLMFFHGDINSVNVLKESIEDFGAYSDRLPVKYLGVPLTSKRIKVSNCKSLLDRIRNKDLNWKNTRLSYAGRLQLVASVLEYVHVYWEFVFLLSKARLFIIKVDIDDMVVKDLVGNGICIWPSEWVEKYPNLSLIQNVVIDEFKQDEM